MATQGIQEDRAARNQALFRDYNEHLEPFNEAQTRGGPFLARWVCECAAEACDVPVHLEIGEYEAIRSEPDRFLVAPSDEHVFPEVERVVEREVRYWVVEKIGRAGEVAERFDPRARNAELAQHELELHRLERVAWNLPEARPPS